MASGDEDGEWRRAREMRVANVRRVVRVVAIVVESCERNEFGGFIRVYEDSMV